MIEEDILGCCLVFVLVGRVGCALWLEESGQHSPGKTRCCFSSASYNIVSADTSYRHLTTCLYSQDQLRVIATKNRLSHYFEGDFIVLHIDRIWNESILSSYSDFWNVPFDKYMKYRGPNYKH